MKRLEEEEDKEASKVKRSYELNTSEFDQIPLTENTVTLTRNQKRALTNEEKLIHLLKKTNRTLNDLMQIEHLTEDLKFFEQINKDATNQKGHLHRKICKYLKFDYRQKGRVVFYQGDIADSFYIVLQGKCLVLINDNSQNQSQQQQSQQINTPQSPQPQGGFSNVINSIFNESKKQVQSPMGTGAKKSFSLFQKLQNNNNLLSTQKILRWRLLHKLVWTIIHVSRFIRLAQRRELKQTERSPNYYSRLFRMYGQKSFMNERFQRIRKEVQQNVHPDIDIQYLENAPHFFDKQNTQSFNYQAVKLYQKGESFGELGLLSRKPRSATVICLTDCIFASLSKNHYSKTLKQVEQHLIDKRIDFLFQTFLPQQLKTTNNIKKEEDDDEDDINNESDADQAQQRKQLISYSESKLNKIQLYFNKIKYNAGKILQKQGEPIEKLYIIKKGEVNCYLNVPSTTNPSTTQKINISVLGKYEIVGDDILLRDNAKEKQKKKKKQEESENIIENMETDEQAIQTGQENRVCYYNAVVKSFNCSVLVITKQDFKRMLNEYPEVKKYLKVKAQTKIEWMEQRKKEQIQLMKKIALIQQKTNFNDEQKQMIQDNPHLLRKHQFKKFKRNSIDNSIIRRNFQSQQLGPELQTNHNLQSNNQQAPSSQSPPKQQTFHSQVQTRKNSKQNQLTEIMINYFQKDLQHADTLLTKSRKEKKSEQMIQDALTIKYGYNPSSLSSQKLSPSNIIDFIFNHQENEQEQQNEQILQLSGLKSNSVDPQSQQNLSPDKNKNSERDQKSTGYKIDYSTLGYSDSLIQSIKRRQTMIDLMNTNGSSNLLSNKSHRQLSNSVEKPKKKLHITHDAMQLKQINKLNKQILKSTQEIQRTTAFYNQSKEIFINNLASSSKSSVVSPLRYKKLFNSKISKKQEFEKLFSKTISSPKSKGLHKQQSCQDFNSNRSMPKSSVHSNMSSESLSPSNIKMPKSPQIRQQQKSPNNKSQKSPSAHTNQKSPASRPETYSQQNSPQNFSSCIRQTSFGQSPLLQKNSLSILTDTPPIFRKLNSINLQDTFQLNKQDSFKEDASKKSQLQNHMLSPPNASRSSLSKLSKIIIPTHLKTSENEKQNNTNATNDNSQQLTTIQNTTLPQQNDETQESLKQNNASLLSTRMINYSSSRFRQASDDQKKKFADIFNKLHSPIIKNQNLSAAVVSNKNKELNIHVQQKNQHYKSKSQIWVQSNKFSPFQVFKSQQEIISSKNLSLSQEENQSLISGMLIQSSTQFKQDDKKNTSNSPNKPSDTMKQKKSVFSMQAISSNKLESVHSLKENNISADKIVILNHLGKPVNYYLSHQSQSSLVNLDCISPTTKKSNPESISLILQNQQVSSNHISKKQPTVTDMFTSTSQDFSVINSQPMSKSVETEHNFQFQTPSNSSKAYLKSHFNFNSIFNTHNPIKK